MTKAEQLEFERQKELALKQFENLYNPKNSPLSFKVENSPKPRHNTTLPSEKVKPKETFGLNFLRNFYFKNLKIDSDSLIIIALILLLSG